MSRHVNTMLTVRLAGGTKVQVNSHYENTATDAIVMMDGDGWSVAMSGGAAELRRLACDLLLASLEVDFDEDVRHIAYSLRTALALDAEQEPADVEGVPV